MQTFSRYLLFQLPAWFVASTIAWGLDAWSGVPRLYLGLALATLLIVDLALYPFVRASYELRSHQPGEDMVGRRGIVVVDLAPSGWVQVGSERWRARVPVDRSPLATGSPVGIRALEGHVLIVEEIAESSSRPSGAPR